MVGQKLPQLKEAMGQILSEINPDDFFTLILFSDFAQVTIHIIVTRVYGCLETFIILCNSPRVLKIRRNVVTYTDLDDKRDTRNIDSLGQRGRLHIVSEE